MASALLLSLASMPQTGAVEFRSVGPSDVRQLRALLDENYITSPDGALQTVYSARMLQWLLTFPGSHRELSLGASEHGSHDLVGFVCAVPSPVLVKGVARDAVEVTLLSVRQSWRGHGIARKLLAELRVRGAAHGVRCAVYTGAERRGQPVLTVRCSHRPLRLRALVRKGFLELPPEVPLSRLAAAQPPLPRAPRELRLRRMRPADVAECRALACARAAESDLGASATLEQFRHKFLNAPGVCSLVLPARQSGAPARAFISFALQPVRTRRGRPILQAVLLGLALAPGESAHWLLAQALVAARQRGAHVFNALPLGELTARMLAALGFGEGDGSVHVYVEDSDSGSTVVPTFKAKRVCWIPLP
jgi:GNAT superfamily N-acetyltransferase